MHAPKVAVLLCTRNGGKFLAQQMDSFFAQTHGNWELWISDDNSADDTREIISRYKERGKKITVLAGPGKGASFNFLQLLRNPNIDADYFAWSDQDDVWLPDKLARAANALDTLSAPAIHASRTELTDSEGSSIGFSPLFTKEPCFANALCQNIAGGNTMTFNRAARSLMLEGETPLVAAHDWWAYLLVTGAGGTLLYDPRPSLLYRQHGGNLVGENRSLRAKFRRLRLIFSGEYHAWNAANAAALAPRRRLLTPENAARYDAFAAALRAHGSLDRLRLLRESGVRRQSAFQDRVFRAAALCRRYP